MSCNVSNFMFAGMCCGHCGVDFNNMALLCVEETECLCVKSSGCLVPGMPDKGVGLMTENEICKLGLYCFDIAIQSPQTLCRGASQILCIKNVVSLPCHDDYVPKFVCAMYGLQCAPECGCLVAPPKSEALNKLVKTEMMDR